MSEVLLVEDEPAISIVVEEVLRDSGFDVVSATTDTEAYACLEGEPRSFAALVTDINLGCATTGFDVARRARELHPHIKVIYVTGRPSNIEAAERETTTFPKPFSPFDLANRLRQMVGEPN